MNPTYQSAPQSPQMPQQNPMMAGSSAQPRSPQQAAVQGQPTGKSPQMPGQPFSASHHHIYDTLRNNLMELVKAGVPGIEKVLAALNNEHVNGMKSQAQQPPQMPSTQGGLQAMQGGAVGQAFSQMPAITQGGR